MLVVVHRLDLPDAAGEGHGKLAGRIHRPEQNLRDRLPPGLPGLPSLQNGVHVVLRPGHAQGAAAHQHDHRRLPGRLHRFQQFFLQTGQADVVPIAVLAAGPAEGGIPLRVVPDHDNTQICRGGLVRCGADAGRGNVQNPAPETHRVDPGPRTQRLQALQHGGHQRIRLRGRPVPQNGLAVGVRTGHEEAPRRTKRQDAVVLQQHDPFTSRLQGRFPVSRGAFETPFHFRNRRFEEPERKFRRQDLPDGRIDPLLRNPP